MAGRFSHEAAVYDPITGSIFLTEDNFGFGSGFYRYDPPVHPRHVGRIEDGGKLWMLGIDRAPQANLSGAQVRGTRYRVRWIRILQPNPQFPMVGGRPTLTNNQAISNVGKQGWDGGAAVFSRLEGLAWHDDRLYFTATQGGGVPEVVDWATSGGDLVTARFRAGHRSGVGLRPPSQLARGRLSIGERERPPPSRQHHAQSERDDDPCEDNTPPAGQANTLQALTRAGPSDPDRRSPRAARRRVRRRRLQP